MKKQTPNFIVIAISILSCFISVTKSTPLKTFTAQYGPFNSTYHDIFEIISPATINNNALQLTPDSGSPDMTMFMTYNSARILLKQPFKLWDDDDDDANVSRPHVASFNSSFLINVYRLRNDTTGEGLAFVIAPNLLLPPNSFGQFLGLTNSMTDNRADNRLVAVEFDTFKQYFDPDDNHVGINVNSIESIKTEYLTPHNITISPIGAKFYNVWVDYDGLKMAMDVYIAEQAEWNGGTPPKPGSPILSADLNLRDIVNHIESIKTEYLTPHNITISPIGAKFYNVWVDYDGLKMVMDVYIAEQAEWNGGTPPKPGSPILSADLNLRDIVNQYSYFGFSASTGNDSQLNCVLRWNLTVNHFPGTGKGSEKRLKIVVAAGVAALLLVVAVVAAGFGYCFHKQRVASSNSKLLGALKCLPGTPREFKFRDLKKATNGFDEKNKLGQGGFGVVYRGVLVKENMEIAVKRFSRGSVKGQHDFLAELTIINRLRHKHLVKLLGWCHKNGKLLLVYEYMPNGSLDQHLFVGPNKDPLEWNLRHRIVSGVASALHYLHNEYDQKVVHRDLKASNIMLDSDFNARLGDFGLARALDNEKTSYLEAEGVLGTMGYIAPECFLTGKATQQSDVYALGLDGKLLEAVDQRLSGDDYVVEEADRFLRLGLACSHPNAGERPKTEAIIQIISGTMPVPEVPPFKPAFVWPAGGPMDMDSVNTMSITSSDFVSGWSRQNLGREGSVGQTDSLV
ncbi:hypothetical protein DH2020_047819 [Rehmannia glutinosa]|uniref:non-specific serine/threonine protein kinase n=1 Tax=Rehmannia glutinosa TaxID=99300 RepID=A0ABR0U7A7_REHGL